MWDRDGIPEEFVGLDQRYFFICLRSVKVLNRR